MALQYAAHVKEDATPGPRDRFGYLHQDLRHPAEYTEIIIIKLLLLTYLLHGTESFLRS
jgi:hypothetical protein